MIEVDFNFTRIEKYKDTFLNELKLSNSKKNSSDLDQNKLKNLQAKNFLKEIIYNSNNICSYKSCPYCGCTRFIKFGKYQNIQRYRCKNPLCKCTFSNATNSMWKYTKFDSEKWLKYIELMFEGNTLESTSNTLGISVSTAFNWRHKILHALENNFTPKKFKEVVHITTYLADSCYKGSRNKHFTSAEKKKKKLDRLFGSRNRNIKVVFSKDKNNPPLIYATMPTEDIQSNFETNIHSILDSNCYVHPDGYNSFSLLKCIIDYNKTLSRKVIRQYDMHIAHNYIRTKLQDNIKDDEKMRAFISNLLAWKSRFRGIASKYINHYYNFYSLIVDSNKFFNSLDTFFDLLKIAPYTSMNELRATHKENY